MRIPIDSLTSDLERLCPEVTAVHDGTDIGFYRFVSGRYDGMVYTYIDPRIHDEEPPRLEFQYTIMSDPLKKRDRDDFDEEHFHQTIGDILVTIINHYFTGDPDE